MDIPKGFLPSEDQGQLFAFTEGSQGISFEDMMRASAGGGQDRRARAQRRELHVHRGRSGVNAALNSGRIFARLKTARRGPHVDRDHRGAAPQAGADSRHQRLSAESAADPHRRRSSPRASTSSRCRARTPNELYQYAPQLEQQPARASRNCRTSPATCRSRIRRSPWSIDRDRPRALGVDPDARSKTRSTTPTARARSRRSTRPTTSTG